MLNAALTVDKSNNNTNTGEKLAWNIFYEDEMPETPIYKIIFFSMGQIYEVYARHIFQSDLYGFIEVEQLVFGERSQMLVDPSEERLTSEFEGVDRTYLHSIARIDEVAKEGIGKISEAKGGNVSPFPMPAFTPKGKSD